MPVNPQTEWTEEEDYLLDEDSSSKEPSFARCKALVGVLNHNHENGHAEVDLVFRSKQ